VSNNNQEAVSQLPENFDELKKAVNRKADWEARLNAVNELGKIKEDEATKILKYVAKADLVTKVREAATQILNKRGVKAEPFEPIIGGLFKDQRKIFVRIKKSLPKDHAYEDFKVKLEKMRSDIFNTYEGEKGADFDAWLKDMWETTRTQR